MSGWAHARTGCLPSARRAGPRLDRDRYLHEYLSLARELRDGGLRTQVYLESKGLLKQFKYAERAGIPFTIVAGEDEFTAGTVKVRSVADRTEEAMPRADIVPYLRERI